MPGLYQPLVLNLARNGVLALCQALCWGGMCPTSLMPLKGVLLLPPYKWGDGGTERLSKLPKITQPVRD